MLETECARFLYHEADLLDRRQFAEWFSLTDPAIDYRVPVRSTRLTKDGDGFSDTAYFLKEDHGTLAMRIERLKSDFAWAENPPTRTRRLIANIRTGSGPSSGELAVKSNFAVYCFRGDDPSPAILTGERQDILATGSESWTITKRLVLLDITVLGMDSLSIFL
jgi:3-phenylpropionate/cinnamic acid dioxygenase small subunit